jgi:succinoglycan biosynthesis protein ExoL
MTEKNIKILTILSLIGHPRDSKRISMLQEAGFDIEAVAFSRDYHNGRMPNCNIDIIGKIENGKYFQRFIKILNALPKIRRAMNRNNIIYVSGIDMAFMAIFASIGKKKPIVLEVGDIREIQVLDGLMGRIVRAIDKFMLRSVDLLVVTSPSFLEVYYRQWLKSNILSIVIENKLELSVIEKMACEKGIDGISGLPIKERPLKIGYFGLLRDLWSYEVLENLAQNYPHNFEIVLAGLPIEPKDLINRIKKYDNIKYLGEYSSPKDLPSLYNSVDMIWACYPPIAQNDWNLKWARPNRFYESCFFEKPTFTRAGCQDAKDVERYKTGMIIDEVNIEDVVLKIANIKYEQWLIWHMNLVILPKNVYTMITEIKELSNSIKNLR